MNKAIIYTRFSPQRNSEEKDSCETQEQICREYAEKNGLNVAYVAHDEAQSGGEEDRPKLWECIEMLNKGDTLLVWKRDRLARSVYLAECINRSVHKAKATIQAVSGDMEGDSPEIVFQRQMLASFSEYERKVIAARTSAAMRAKQSTGRMMSKIPPYGYNVDPDDTGRMIANQEEQAIVEKIKGLKATGWTISQIVRFLNRNHKESCRGAGWNSRTVARIVRREC